MAALTGLAAGRDRYDTKHKRGSGAAELGEKPAGQVPGDTHHPAATSDLAAGRERYRIAYQG